MATDEVRKKWGTIFMGDREASVEELSAMHERLNRDKIQKEQTEDYMERVRARAADRAREILGAAYQERQKVLEEAKAEAASAKREAARECAAIKGEGEEMRRQAKAELDKARTEREQAEAIRASAHEEGYQDGMAQAGAELQEFRGEMGQALGVLMRAIERQRRQILETWREDLAALVQAAAKAGTSYVLRQDQEAVLRQLVFQALDYLETRTAISFRVNPAEEEQVSDMFRAARERIPELKQWTVHGDAAIKPGGLIADSGGGSVDLRRENFQEMVENVLSHLGLPEQDGEEAEREVAQLVEQEVAHIASLTPEPDQPGSPQPEAAADASPEPQAEPSAPKEPQAEPAAAAPVPEQSVVQDELAQQLDNPSLAELEDELFPLDEEVADKAPESGDAAVPTPEAQHPAEEKLAPEAPAAPQLAPKATAKAAAKPAPVAETPEPEKVELDAKTLSEGGFL